MHMHLLEMEQLSLGDEIQIQICYNQRNGSRSEAQQSAQPPLKKIKLEQLDQPSSSDPATECLRCLPSMSRDREQRDKFDQDFLCILKETLNNVNKILGRLKNIDCFYFFFFEKLNFILFNEVSCI